MRDDEHTWHLQILQRWLSAHDVGTHAMVHYPAQAGDNLCGAASVLHDTVSAGHG